jgi:hypothetical protein
MSERLSGRAPRGADFRNHPITIRDQNRLAAGGKPNVFAELIFKDFQTNGAHKLNRYQRLLCQKEANPSAKTN